MNMDQMKFNNLKLLVLDVDGVLTDGQLYFSNSGEEIKAFNSQDGLGIKLLQKEGIDVAIITGRTSGIVNDRASSLGIRHVIQGCGDKLTALNTLCEDLSIGYTQIAYMGDDLPDLASINRVALGMAVANANPEIIKHANWCSIRKGGFGAVREACDYILDQRGALTETVKSFL
jgi:3-deoxy-D-manno-octulosonate 8-phosphate phosphatase (KDO 8-P phosphatase)